jgi:D-beta-D-heptose 7-phosphate kinase/D-beta-D-heptose 1-phosphate adenosyltransferase
VLALCAAQQLEVQQATVLANLAAGIVIGKLGTVPVTRDELLGAVRAAADPYQGKTLSLPQLIEKTRVWRAAGERIVFTNGCFDLLHVGHVTLLEQCKRLGDRLIIGINSDASVSRLKGPTRPIIGQAERARLLSALTATDAVVIFDEATPIELIRAIRPDVLVKGGDYTEATVVGADEVSAWGGRVELVPLVAGFSTTEIVRRMGGGAEKSASERAGPVGDGRLS